MANSNRYKMSLERLEELKAELHYMETVREKEVSEQLSERKISKSSVAWPIAFRMALESLFIERHPELFS